eukprot:1735093-Pleurochrysis_carterae.AAC.1
MRPPQPLARLGDLGVALREVADATHARSVGTHAHAHLLAEQPVNHTVAPIAQVGFHAWERGSERGSDADALPQHRVQPVGGGAAVAAGDGDASCACYQRKARERYSATQRRGGPTRTRTSVRQQAPRRLGERQHACSRRSEGRLMNWCCSVVRGLFDLDCHPLAAWAHASPTRGVPEQRTIRYAES